MRLVGLFIAGWVSGWLSWVSLGPTIDDHVSGKAFLDAFVQPFELKLESLWSPYSFFGCVGFVSYFFLNLCRQLVAKRLTVHLVIGGLSGFLGSLWFWTALTQQWYISLLHGTIWGSLVGFGVWKSQQTPKISG